MRIQDAIETFGNALELAPGEAAVYVHLCVSGPAKAADLATLLDLHRNEVYRTANRLIARGLVEMTLERPARYAAVAPDAVFDNEIRARLATIDRLRHVREEVSPMLASMERFEMRPREKSTYKLVQGREEIYATRRHMIEDASREILWATTFAPSLKLMAQTGGLDLLARRVAEGVRLRAIVRAPDAELVRLAPILRAAPGAVRTFDPPSHVRFVVVDGQDLLMWVVNDPSDALHAKDEVAIHTTAPGFVQAETLFFEQSWQRAQPL